MVPRPYAVGGEDAVVVHSRHARAAPSAVVGSARFRGGRAETQVAMSSAVQRIVFLRPKGESREGYARGVKPIALAIGRWLRTKEALSMLLTLEVCAVRSGRTNAPVQVLDPAPGFPAEKIRGSLPALTTQRENGSRMKNSAEYIFVTTG